METGGRVDDSATLRSTSRRVGLTPSAVIDAALELSEGVGIGAWSQRDLAARLDVATGVIYHHVGGRDAVLRGVVERVLARLPLPDPDLPWQDWFRAWLFPAQGILLRFPGTARWALMHGPAFPQITPFFDAGIAALRRGGVPDAPFVYGAIVNTAMLTISMRDDRRVSDDDGPRDHSAMLRDFMPLRDQSAGVAAVIDELILPLVEGGESLTDVHTRYYRFVVESMLAGVATRLTGEA